MHIRLPVVLCIFSLATYSHQAAYAAEEPDFWIGAAIEGGKVSVKTHADAEINKTGRLFGGKGFSEVVKGSSLFHMGLGLDGAFISGHDLNLEIKQSHETRSGYLELAWYWRLSNTFMPGVALRISHGPGANYSVRDQEKVATFLQAGPTIHLGYPKLFKDVDLMGQITWLESGNNRDRRVSAVLATIGFAYPVKWRKEPSPEPARVATAAPKYVATLGTTLLRFKLGSAVPDQASLGRLTKLARALADHGENWTSLEIFGHTDSTGKKAANLVLSQDRAASVKRILIENGVPAAKLIKAEGYGDDQLLPGLRATAPEHRRVALMFDGVKDIETFNRMMEDIFGETYRKK